MINKVDILAIGAHPDDVELACSGTLMKSIAEGKKAGICDLTQGELGTRGSGELRLEEAERARAIIGADFRVNLGMADGFFEVNQENKLKIVEVIRACRPDIVLCNALSDRHPDHGRSAELENVACFLSGLRRIETSYDGKAQEPWRPRLVLHYIQDNFLSPDIVVDVSPFWERKMEAIKAFSSQFYDPNSKEPASSISSKDFMDMVEGRGLNMGRYLFARYGEGYQSERPLGVESVFDLL
ncbi:MAG: bacillithiol biosynthesis deacetylase BshB1 [Flavobacteriales bacterium]